MHKLIIDCDPGHDDAIALILAHRHARVLGITTVSGNAPLAATTRNALAVTVLIGADTPVHRGAAHALDGGTRHAPHVHGESGLGGVELPEHDRTVASNDAVTFILATAAPDVWLIPIGPLTNIALALERDPGLARRIAGISLMGGSSTIGNVTRTAEFNIWADPEAAAVVFASGAEIVMCGLNLTHQLRTTDATVATLGRSSGARARFAAQVFAFLHDRMEHITGQRSAALHDPCAILAVTHPALFQTTRRAVDVEVSGEHTRGMTVVEQRPGKQAGDSSVQVAEAIDASEAMRLVLDSLI